MFGEPHTLAVKKLYTVNLQLHKIVIGKNPA